MRSPDKAKRVDQVKTLELSVSAIIKNSDDDQEATAREFATHPDFSEARADGLLWDATSLDGSTEPAV